MALRTVTTFFLVLADLVAVSTRLLCLMAMSHIGLAPFINVTAKSALFTLTLIALTEEHLALVNLEAAYTHQRILYPLAYPLVKMDKPTTALAL